MHVALLLVIIPGLFNAVYSQDVFNMDNQDVRLISDLTIPATVRSISLENNQISRLYDGDFQKFSQLQTLNLRSNSIAVIGRIYTYFHFILFIYFFIYFCNLFQ